MSRSEIKRGGRSVRPTFDYTAHDGSTPTDSCIAQTIESLRNLQESYNADFLFALQQLVRTLDRLDRRLAKHLPLTSRRGVAQ